MKAENRPLSDWFNRVRTGQVRLPRFQRYEVWGHAEVSSLLETVFRELPSGATLLLQVDEEEQFPSRSISGAPDPTEKCEEHLLDGQQRLTALWRCVNDLYDDRTYFVYFRADSDHDGAEMPCIYGQARWWKNGIRHPLWCDVPREVHGRGYLPLGLMRTDDDIFREIRKWCDLATANDLAESRELEDRILSMRKQMLSYNLPYLALPATTPPDVALDVFIKLNTTAVKLSTFDIMVARFEDETGQSLRQLASQLCHQVPAIERYLTPEDLILSAAAMREGRAPTQANYERLDLKRLHDEWPELVAGVRWAVGCLEQENVFDEARLPTVAVVPVLTALHADEALNLERKAGAKTLIRKYLWRAFLTRRYENSVSGRQLQDLNGLRYVLAGHADETEVPIFDHNQFPLPTVEELMLAGWPKRRDTLARGILAITLKGGAIDVADNEPVSAGHIRLRDYQHLYPYALLTGDGQMPNSECFQALNCVLMTWDLQRFLSAQKPRSLFKKRDKAADLSREVIMDRLGTHAVPIDHLPQESYAKIGDPDDRAEKIRVDYQAFLKARAEQLREAIEVLCDGEDWPGEGAARRPAKKTRAAS
ncbi:MAG: DUF262 domain-containing protein [Kiloniellales bacterium]|nr:DUF262 domain-containing protein [Kiloniellales bacterium]